MGIVVSTACVLDSDCNKCEVCIGLEGEIEPSCQPFDMCYTGSRSLQNETCTVCDEDRLLENNCFTGKEGYLCIPVPNICNSVLQTCNAPDGCSGKCEFNFPFLISLFSGVFITLTSSLVGVIISIDRLKNIFCKCVGGAITEAVLPLYRRLILLVSIAILLVGGCGFVICMLDYVSGMSEMAYLHDAQIIYLCINVVVWVLFGSLFLLPSLSKATFVRIASLVWLIGVIPLLLLWSTKLSDIEEHPSLMLVIIQTVYGVLFESILPVIYLIIVLVKLSNKTIRPSVKLFVYCGIAFSIMNIYTTALAFIHVDDVLQEWLRFIDVVIESLLLILWLPVTITVMKRDTEYWRGVGTVNVMSKAADFTGYYSIQDGAMESLHSVVGSIENRIGVANIQIFADQYLGAGVTSQVVRGIYLDTPVAVKILRVHAMESDVTEQVVIEYAKEIRIAEALKHPNIVELIGMCVAPPNLSLVYELCDGGTLQKFIQDECKTVSLLKRLTMMRQLLDAVAYIHSVSPAIIHRDIKPANILLDKELNVKLTDFGASRLLDPASHMTITGSLLYQAPEVGENSFRVKSNNGHANEMKTQYDTYVDVYSCAMVMFELSTGRVPLEDVNQFDIRKAVASGRRPIFTQEDDLPEKLILLLNRMWAPSVEDRPSAIQARDAIAAIIEDLGA